MRRHRRDARELPDMTPPEASAHDPAAALRAGFAADLFTTDPEITASFARDRTGAYFGMPAAVARPRSAAELAAVVMRCAALGIGIVPQGGLTGLVGAAVARADSPEVVVLLDRMSAIRAIDTVGFSMVVEAGCVLETAKRAAEAEDCLLPITFGAQGSCRIGGNVSTNAGGFNVLRYGMTRDLVLGLEVVLPDGRIWNGLRTLRKDNRGYDLKQLFIGAEGTLGIVTAAALKLFPKPTQIETALVGLGRSRTPCNFTPRRAAAAATCCRPSRSSCGPAWSWRSPRAPSSAIRSRRRVRYYILMELAATGTADLKAILEACLAEAGDAVAGRNHRGEPRPVRAPVVLPRGHGRGAKPRRILFPHRRLGADPGHSRPFWPRCWSGSRPRCRTAGRSPTAMSATATST